MTKERQPTALCRSRRKRRRPSAQIGTDDERKSIGEKVFGKKEKHCHPGQTNRIPG